MSPLFIINLEIIMSDLYTVKGKFHQLLAAFADKDNAARKILTELVKTLTKSDLFDGFRKTYEPLAENGEMVPEESKELVTTVGEKLDFALPIIADGIDAALSKEASNASGKLRAELTVDGKSYGEFDAQTLLQLEKQLSDFRAVVDHLPTLDLTKDWEFNKDEREGSYVVKGHKTYRYIEEVVPVVLYEATKEHPAQVREKTKNTQVGTYYTTYVSGRLTPSEKSEIIKRLDAFLVAIKSARSVANAGPATNVTVAKTILSDIFNRIL